MIANKANQEIWKPCPKWGHRYLISSKNRIYSIVKNRFLKLQKQKANFKAKALSYYYYVNFSNDGQKHKTSMHRLLALAFIPNPHNLPEVNHKDEDKLNNDLGNLEWCTHLQNVRHSQQTTFESLPRGEEKPNNKLTEKQVKEIRRKYCKNLNGFKKLGKEYGVDRKTIKKIIKRQKWKHI